MPAVKTVSRHVTRSETQRGQPAKAGCPKRVSKADGCVAVVSKRKRGNRGSQSHHFETTIMPSSPGILYGEPETSWMLVGVTVNTYSSPVR